MSPSALGWEEIRIGIALSAIAAVSVVLRFVSRLVKRMKIGLDDWMAVASLISISVMLIQLILWAVIGNSGKHMSALDAEQLIEFNKRRIFATPRFRLVANALCVGCIIWAAIAILGFGLQCQPLSRQWDSTIPGTCDNQLAFIEGIQGINIFLDFAIFAVPWPMIWNLHRPWQDKVALSGVFLLGGFVVGASIYRMVALTEITSDDITYTVYSGEIWTFVEPCIGLVCGCLPTIRALFPVYAATKKNASRAYVKQIPMVTWGAAQFEGDRSRLDAVDYHDQGTLDSSCLTAGSMKSVDGMHSVRHIEFDISMETV